MSKLPWLLCKTEKGKNFCLWAFKKDGYDSKIDYDAFATAFPGANKDNILDFQDAYKKTLENKKVSRSINGISKNGEKLGRPALEETRKEIVYRFFREKNADSFPDDILKQNNLTNSPEIIENNDLYVELAIQTLEKVKNDFYAENTDLIKLHPSRWFRNLCNTFKKSIPSINGKYNNPYVINKMWELYSDLCLSIGINRTLENFQIFTGLNWGDIDKIKNGVNSDYRDLAKKIYDCCKSDIVGGLSSSFGSSPNQMFIAKSVYGLTENTVVTHVSAAADTKKIDDIPVFNIECSD